MVLIKEKVEENYDFLVNSRKHFHKYPELHAGRCKDSK